jgi:hypothetical protein
MRTGRPDPNRSCEKNAPPHPAADTATSQPVVHSPAETLRNVPSAIREGSPSSTTTFGGSGRTPLGLQSEEAEPIPSIPRLSGREIDNERHPMMRFYRPEVLAMFHARSEKYRIRTDEFEGEVSVSDDHYRESAGYLNVSFGFRACTNGEWAVAAYAPDLDRATPDEQQLWTGFEITDRNALTPVVDERFQKWRDRYIMGSWNIKDGPIVLLDRVVLQINAVTHCVVNAPLFNYSGFRMLCFPSAENNHRYQDAHSEVYKLVIDGLNKEAITKLGGKLGIAVKAGDKNTFNALEMLFPSDSVRAAIRKPLDQVSAQRRLADHKQRPAAQKFSAFAEFGKDMRALVEGFEILRDDLASRLNVNIARCEKRVSAMKGLPVFNPNRPPQPNYAIFPAFEMTGKQVTRVHAGELVAKPGRSESEEALILEFSDGSLMSIEAGANNLTDLLRHGEPVEQEQVHIRFYVTYVPPMLPFASTEDEPRSVMEVVE